MDAGSVTTARTVMRPAHPVQRVTSTSKVRRKRAAQSTRESGAYSAPPRPSHAARTARAPAARCARRRRRPLARLSPLPSSSACRTRTSGTSPWMRTDPVALPHGRELRRGRRVLHRVPLSRGVGPLAPPVGIVRLHRHRQAQPPRAALRQRRRLREPDARRAKRGEREDADEPGLVALPRGGDARHPVRGEARSLRGHRCAVRRREARGVL